MRSVSVILGVVAAAASFVAARETSLSNITTTGKPVKQARVPYYESRGNWTKTIQNNNNNNNNNETRDIRVENITLHWPYELRDGQIIFTDPSKTLVPSPGGDFAVLGQSAFRNVHGKTGKPVSLDEVYVHHVIIFGSGFGMVGAEALNQVLNFPEGSGFVVRNSTEFGINAHLLSNKNLKHIEGSLELARKQCNECYYAEGKGDLCTPATNGTFACCGDGALMGEHGVPIPCGLDATQCNCATTTTSPSTTPYELQMDFMVTYDLDAIQPINTWTMMAPSCYAPVGKGLGVDTSSVEAAVAGGCQSEVEGSTYHNVYRNNTETEKKTTGRWLAHFDGVARWALGHLHTGGINISLSINGEDICTSHTAYGTEPSPSASFEDENNSENARNEYGHLIDIYDCFNTTTMPEGVPIQAGDLVEVTSYYYVGDDDERLPEGAGGSHLNVMSYMNINFEITGGEVSEYYELPAQIPGNESVQIVGGTR